jgi:hypothetical protein
MMMMTSASASGGDGGVAGSLSEVQRATGSSTAIAKFCSTTINQRTPEGEPIPPNTLAERCDRFGPNAEINGLFDYRAGCVATCARNVLDGHENSFALFVAEKIIRAGIKF